MTITPPQRLTLALAFFLGFGITIFVYRTNILFLLFGQSEPPSVVQSRLIDDHLLKNYQLGADDFTRSELYTLNQSKNQQYLTYTINGSVENKYLLIGVDPEGKYIIPLNDGETFCRWLEESDLLTGEQKLMTTKCPHLRN